MIELFGRFHILILHLPIGILTLYIILVWTRSVQTLHTSFHFRKSILFIGFVSAIISCITGFVLSRSGDYDLSTVDNHQWAAILLSLFVLGLWCLYPNTEKIEKISSACLAIGLLVTGHLGGVLTHGDGFLSLGTTEKENELVFSYSSLDEAGLYKDFVQPILDARCVSCHGPKKQKGKLRLDTYAHIVKGGKSNDDLIDKNISTNALLGRILLPLSDKKHMPPRSKAQLLPDHLTLIKTWLSDGADTTKNIVGYDDRALLMTAIKNLESMSVQVDHKDLSVKKAYLPEVELDDIKETALTRLEQLDIVALRAGKESNFIEVNFINVQEITEEHWTALATLADHVVRLRLSDHEVRDQDLIHVAKMDHLVHLYLDGTHVTDEGITYLKDLAFLSVLNLNGTEITTKAVNFLSDLLRLEKVYAYQTALISSDSTTSFNLITGSYAVPTLESDTIRIPY